MSREKRKTKTKRKNEIGREETFSLGAEKERKREKKRRGNTHPWCSQPASNGRNTHKHKTDENTSKPKTCIIYLKKR